MGSTTYKVLWTNSTSKPAATTIALREAHREAMRKYYPAVFADRDLTAAERTRFDVLADPRRVCR